MKNMVLIIQASMQQDLADHMRTLTQVTGFTFSHVEGHGSQVEHDPLLSVRDKVVGYTPRVRVDILLEDADVANVLDGISQNLPGVKGHGVYWVYDVDRHGRL